MEIRDEAVGDGPAIRHVVQEAFGRPAEARLVDLLRSRGELVLSLVAAEGVRVVGHVAVSPMSFVPAVELRALGLGPIAVVPDRQRCGVGTALMEAAIGRVQETGWDALFILGDPAYYRRFGFRTAPVTNEYGAGEAFMVLELTPACLTGVEAMARYVLAFGEVGG